MLACTSRKIDVHCGGLLSNDKFMKKRYNILMSETQKKEHIIYCVGYVGKRDNPDYLKEDNKLISSYSDINACLLKLYEDNKEDFKFWSEVFDSLDSTEELREEIYSIIKEKINALSLNKIYEID